ncbi:MAG: hypothetical protein ACI8QY_000925, partial [bacterium]
MSNFSCILTENNEVKMDLFGTDEKIIKEMTDLRR